MTELDLFKSSSMLGSYCSYMVDLGDTKQIVKIIWVVAAIEHDRDDGGLNLWDAFCEVKRRERLSVTRYEWD